MLKDYFLTFGTATPNGQCYKRIKAPDYASARAEAFRVYGKHWAFLYSKEEFGDDAERFCLRELEPALTVTVDSEYKNEDLHGQ